MELGNSVDSKEVLASAWKRAQINGGKRVKGHSLTSAYIFICSYVFVIKHTLIKIKQKNCRTPTNLDAVCCVLVCYDSKATCSWLD